MNKDCRVLRQDGDFLKFKDTNKNKIKNQSRRYTVYTTKQMMTFAGDFAGYKTHFYLFT
jgi:hypothetical protein